MSILNDSGFQLDQDLSVIDTDEDDHYDEQHEDSVGNNSDKEDQNHEYNENKCDTEITNLIKDCTISDADTKVIQCCTVFCNLRKVQVIVYRKVNT